MAGVVRNWRAELVEAYPDLFHPSANNPGVAAASPQCDEGWNDLLQRACVRIRAAVQADGGAFKFTQIKEKYGTARLYWSGRLSPEAAPRVEDAIDMAEARSATTCEVCGDPGRLYGGGWLTTRCARHAEGRTPVEVRVGFENIHVVRRVVGGRFRIASCRRYDRDADVFVDVEPRTLGIEEE
jgi:hypothetical protein